MRNTFRPSNDCEYELGVVAPLLLKGKKSENFSHFMTWLLF